MENRCYYKNLPKALDRYEPQNDYERSLVSAMKEGLDFLSPEHGIMQYSYDPFYEEEPECLPMYLHQQIRVVYDSNDMVTDYCRLLQFIQQGDLRHHTCNDTRPITGN